MSTIQAPASSSADQGATARPTEEMRKARTSLFIYSSLIFLVALGDPGKAIKFPGADIQISTANAFFALWVVSSFFFASFAVETYRATKVEPDGASKLAVAEFLKMLDAARDRVGSLITFSHSSSEQIKSEANNLSSIDSNERSRVFGEFIDGLERERAPLLDGRPEITREQYEDLRNGFNDYTVKLSRAVSSYQNNSNLQTALNNLTRLITDHIMETPRIEQSLSDINNTITTGLDRVERAQAAFRKHERLTLLIWDISLTYICYAASSAMVFIELLFKGEAIGL